MSCFWFRPYKSIGFVSLVSAHSCFFIGVGAVFFQTSPPDTPPSIQLHALVTYALQRYLECFTEKEFLLHEKDLKRLV